MRLVNKFVILACMISAPHATASCVNVELTDRDYIAIGTVKNLDGEIIYEEHHLHDADQNGGMSIVDYKTPTGELIAKKVVDYDCRASAPNYVLTMKRESDWIEKVNWESSQLVITKVDDSESLTVISADDLVIDAGFDNYIFDHWRELLSGQRREIDFLHVPGERLIKLIISLEDDIETSKYSMSTNVAVFRIATKSKLLRLFSDSIYLGYDKTTKQLDFYAGPTNLRGAIVGLDKSRKIVINYQYN